jgi:hypothetical protein
MAIGYTSLGTATNGSSGSISLGSKTLTAGNLYLLAVFQNRSGAPTPAQPSVSATGVTFELVGTVTYNSFASPLGRLTLYRCMPSATTTTAITVSNTNGNATIGYHLSEWTGTATTGANGTGAVGQYITGLGDGTANPSLTLDAVNAFGTSAVVAYFQGDASPFGGTAEAGWTESHDGGFSSAASYVTYRLATTDNTVQVTRAAADWAGIAVEIRGAQSRRILHVN